MQIPREWNVLIVFWKRKSLAIARVNVEMDGLKLVDTIGTYALLCGKDGKGYIEFGNGKGRFEWWGTLRDCWYLIVLLRYQFKITFIRSDCFVSSLQSR